MDQGLNAHSFLAGSLRVGRIAAGRGQDFGLLHPCWWLILSVAIGAATVGCTSGLPQSPGPSGTGFLGAPEPSPVQPSPSSPDASGSPEDRPDGVWKGVITGHYEDQIDTSEVEGGKGHLVQDVEVAAVLTEKSTPLIGPAQRAIGRNVSLDPLGTVVTASMSHINRVDGTTCTGEGSVTVSSDPRAGWIVEKWDTGDVTSAAGFDLPVGSAWYLVSIRTEEDEIPSRCIGPNERDDTFEPFVPPIGRLPIIPEADSWDVEIRTLSEDGLTMTGSYQRHWVLGDDVIDLTAEWNLVWAPAP